MIIKYYNSICMDSLFEIGRHSTNPLIKFLIKLSTKRLFDSIKFYRIELQNYYDKRLMFHKPIIRFKDIIELSEYSTWFKIMTPNHIFTIIIKSSNILLKADIKKIVLNKFRTVFEHYPKIKDEMSEMNMAYFMSSEGRDRYISPCIIGSPLSPQSRALRFNFGFVLELSTNELSYRSAQNKISEKTNNCFKAELIAFVNPFIYYNPEKSMHLRV